MGSFSNPWSNEGSGRAGPRQQDEVDYAIRGHDLQFVEIELDPGEAAVGEAGAFVWKDAAIEMSTVFGDGSDNQGGGGIVGALLGAGKRLLTGASLFTTVFMNRGVGTARVAFAAPTPGGIVPLKLSDYGGRIICQKDSFLAAAKGVTIGIAFQRRIMTGLFGGEGFIMQQLDGDGMVFVHMGGTIVERDLAPGETIHVDTGCLAAMTATIDYDIETVRGVRSILFSGEGLFFARLTGPGSVWLQSLPFSRLAGRVLAVARGGSKGADQSSPLGLLGDILDGDR